MVPSSTLAPPRCHRPFTPHPPPVLSSSWAPPRRRPSSHAAPRLYPVTIFIPSPYPVALVFH
ncbi:hypothetical protein Hanom_Chr09g00842111 [Helianthus anomalus]